MATLTSCEVKTRYGMAPLCVARLTPKEVRGLTARQLLDRVCHVPQESEHARRAQRVLAEVMSERTRVIDLEVCRGHERPDMAGDPIDLDDIVVADDSPSEVPSPLTLSLSEPLCGGREG
jgi:hypothetical protein